MPNEMKDSGEGTPFPASGHPGIVNFLMCDGSTVTLSENIDRQVYLRLLTPAGTKTHFPGFLPEDPLSQSDY
jgi:prepilin-type processing-associated H-X9-DG protein